jgi:hypothetical protein
VPHLGIASQANQGDVTSVVDGREDAAGLALVDFVEQWLMHDFSF